MLDRELPRDDPSAMAQLKAVEATLAPLYEDRRVGRRYRDPDGGGDVVVLFRIPEDGDDEALYVYGALLAPATCDADGVVTCFPRWAVSEWDDDDLAKAAPAEADAAAAPAAAAAAAPPAVEAIEL